VNVLVAGASGGIGSACVRALEADGAKVHAIDKNTVDITRPGGAERAVQDAVTALGTLDGVVHAVGMSGRRYGDGPVTSCTDEAWQEVHRVNYESVFRMLRAAIPAMEPGGSIVVIGSALATTLDSDFLTAAYISAKAALIPLIRAAAWEAAPKGVRVNLVSAGLVDTPMAGRALGDPAILARMPELMPLGAGPCQPEEIADAVGWLLSPASRRTTGAIIPVDGGWYLR
jgi:NAD(P)-dependent dehydrogenase (short-subunit alcohol dehydrogenase family)